ncbi:Hypothetical protein CINCED_3A012329 [Cinara cedri]|nr:Hypothetical protein CINCED_3A012329 [Cinara cedri]
MARHRFKKNYFNLANTNNQPQWPTVLAVIMEQLDRASRSLQNARELGGPASGIPTWETLMTAWEAYKASINDVSDDFASAPSITNNEDVQIKWAQAATAVQLRNHPVIRVALSRGVLNVPIVTPSNSPWPFDSTADAHARRVKAIEDDMNAWAMEGGLPAQRPALEGHSDGEETDDDSSPVVLPAVVKREPATRMVPDGMQASPWQNYRLTD